MNEVDLDPELKEEIIKEVGLTSIEGIDVYLVYFVRFEDDSFDHEFGTEVRHSYHAEKLNLMFTNPKNFSNYPATKMSDSIQERLQKIAQDHLDQNPPSL